MYCCLFLGRRVSLSSCRRCLSLLGPPISPSPAPLSTLLSPLVPSLLVCGCFFGLLAHRLCCCVAAKLLFPRCSTVCSPRSLRLAGHGCCYCCLVCHQGVCCGRRRLLGRLWRQLSPLARCSCDLGSCCSLCFAFLERHHFASPACEGVPLCPTHTLDVHLCILSHARSTTLPLALTTAA